MERSDTYCDVCGTRMSRDGSTEVYGIRIKVFDSDNKPVTLVRIQVHANKEHFCGSSSFADYLKGRDFCSYKCFSRSVSSWLERILPSFDEKDTRIKK